MHTAEFVSPRHPDKTCDIIADAIVDAYLKKDCRSRCAIEVMGGHGLVRVTGEVTSNAKVDVIDIVRGIVGQSIEIEHRIVQQSPEIARGVDAGGAGDQGIMVGYATRETESMMPLEYDLARSLCRFIFCKQGNDDDGKTQVTIDGDMRLKAIVVSWRGVKAEDLRDYVRMWADEEDLCLDGVMVAVNPAGDWDQGGFDADSGLTGRKIVVDAYGPRVQVGGGAFSGKDATKVDRSAAYMARKVAVKMLKEMDASEVTLCVAYAIGLAKPLHATAYVATEEGYEVIELGGKELAQFEPKRIISELHLDQPIFQETAQWGHFGNGFEWDR